MKVLVTGVSGQVGSAFCRLAVGEGFEVVCISRREWDMALNPAGGQALIAAHQPNLVVNCAAYTDVDGAELDPCTAYAVNAEALESMALGCKENEIPVIHISTDYVFDGSKDEPYTEFDDPNPINIYGQTKLKGERLLKASGCNYVVLRTSWVFSEGHNNFVTKVLGAFKANNVRNVVSDQFGGPTPAVSIANFLIKISHDVMVGKTQNKVIHVAGTPYVSWFEFAQEIERVWFGQNSSRCLPCLSDELIRVAQRPTNSCLFSVYSDYVGVIDWRSFLVELRGLETMDVNTRKLS